MTVMTARLKIDFVSDVACPWCIIGLNALQQALDTVAGEIQADLQFQPFELNPGLPPEGREIVPYLAEKYGMTAEQVAQNQEAIRARGEAVGFTFNMDKRTRTYNTFDAHRLLHWAGLFGKQLALKRALFAAYFTEGENPGDHAVLLRLANEVGLDADEAKRILASDAYADDVRQQEAFYQRQGIHSVPSIIINDRHLIQGGQPPEVFAQALREIAATDAG